MGQRKVSGRRVGRLGCVVGPASGAVIEGLEARCLLSAVLFVDDSAIVQEELDSSAAASALAAPIAADATLVNIPDANLEAAIRSQLGRATGDITQTDMEGLTYLYASGREIRDLSGLEYATNLITLLLPFNQISDLSPLAGMTGMRDLDLSINQIDDLSPLAGMTEMRDLNLEGNQISDLLPLAGMSEMMELSLGNNQIGDPSPLAGMTGLTKLELSRNQIHELSPLAGLIKLTHLDVDGNQIMDLSPLAGMTGLAHLNVNSNQIRDLSPLTGLKGVIWLYLWNNQITDLSPLVGMRALTWLVLQNNYLNISPGSADMRMIRRLQGAGVSVQYEHQHRMPHISLPDGSVAEKRPGGRVVGMLFAASADNPVTCSLVPGPGSEGNRFFAISGNQLLTNAVFDYDIRHRYSIRVRLTDPVGRHVDKVLRIHIVPAPGTFGAKHWRVFTEVDGDRVSISVRGGGEGVLFADNTIALTGTTAKSVVSITVKRSDGGDGLFHLPGIASDGPLKAINASGVVLSGQVRINTLNLDAGKGSVSLKLRAISDADVQVQGMAVSAITVGTGVFGSKIVATGSIGKFSAGVLEDSEILVGGAAGFDGQFAGHDDFINSAAKLGSLTVTGQRLPKGQAAPAYVANSHISAPSVGTVSLVNVAATPDPIVHVMANTGVLKVSQTKLVAEEMVGSGTWKTAGVWPAIWEVD